MPELLGRDKASPPQTPTVVPGGDFVVLERHPLGGGLGVQRKTLADQELVETGGFAVDGTKARVPLGEGLVGSEILAMDAARADQFCQLVARLDAAGPGIGMVVDAYLVEFRRVDPVKL